SYACLFEAKSIQEYILRSGRLRHVVGASELLDSLTPALFQDALQALGLVADADVRWSRCAGGAVYLFTDDQKARERLLDLWSLTVRQYAPGLDFVLAAGEGDDDYAAYLDARRKLEAARNRPASVLPAGTPVSRYARRTGEPAVKGHRLLGLQDEATARFGLERFWRGQRLAKRFAADEPLTHWPATLDFEPETGEPGFPFLPDNRWLGLLHADGNGLGAVIKALGSHVKHDPTVFVPLFRAFSDAIAAATVEAARIATKDVLLTERDHRSAELADRTHRDRTLAARPIVLGGDDLTILLRGDLAIPFARRFLTVFETTSAEALANLRQRFPKVTGIPEALTAGGGIAFVKSNHPFHLSHELAESVAALAKQQGKQKAAGDRVPPTLAFHRVTSAVHGDYRQILLTERTCGPADAPVQTTLGAYGLDTAPASGLPALAELEALARLLGREDMARGPARQFLTLLGQDHDDAQRRYHRWREVMDDRNPAALAEMMGHLQRLCGALDPDLPVSAAPPRKTPLGDVATLLAITQGTHGEAGAADLEAAA
uniref:Cas10/Cmr2 second palm domain-containing protein n=1 Tax=uncultured Thiohalocapsa sp. TaxID=768990 RepID=UPI0025E0ED97